jgi:two-component system, chemotaxis family, sensor kinase CheA
VVKTNIEGIGGRVDVATQRGIGTTFLIRVPLTLAIMPALIVTSGAERYAIPQVNLLEVARVDPDHATASIEIREGIAVCRLRGRLLPLVELGVELGDHPSQVPAALSEGRAIDIVALQAGHRQFALVVDSVHDTEEIVVKALGRQLTELITFSGATIMGDGQVALILDVAGLAQRARVRPVEQNPVVLPTETPESETTTQKLLVMGVGGGRRMALPIELVQRIEEFSPGLVKRTGGLELVQYGDQIVPLARLSGFLGVEPARATDEVMPVVLAKVEGRIIGLIVDEIVDIVEEQVSNSGHRTLPGMFGSASISGRDTTVIDLDQLADHMQLEVTAP